MTQYEPNVVCGGTDRRLIHSSCLESLEMMPSGHTWGLFTGQGKQERNEVILPKIYGNGKRLLHVSNMKNKRSHD